MKIFYTLDNGVNWTQISAIVDYPDITPRLNTYGVCNVLLRDFEGALFTDWYSRDFLEMKVEDNSENILFRGFLINKKFTALGLALEIAGIGELLERKSFGHEKDISYILQEGYVKTLNANSRIDLQYKDADDNFQDYTWDDDYWINEKDVGLLIQCKTPNVDSKYWTSSAIDSNDEEDDITVMAGDNDSVLSFMDDEEPIDYYSVRDVTDGTPILVITPTIDGIAFSTDKFIKSIEISYNFRVRGLGARIISQTYFTAKLQILKDTTWIDIAEIPLRTTGSGSSETKPWKYAGVTIGDVDYAPHEITESGDSVELAKYFNIVGDEYTSLKGIRFKITSGHISKPQGYAEIHVDLIKVKVTHSDFDILPIMRKITDSGASWVECDSIANWQEMGVTVDEDVFQIGENTRKIIEDVGSEAGLTTALIPEKETIIRPNSDISTNWWYPIGNDGWSYIDDIIPEETDTYACWHDLGDDNKFNTHGFTTLENIKASSITSVTVNVYAKTSALYAGNVELDISFDAGANWEGVKSLGMDADDWNWTWFSQTWAGLSKSSVDDFQVKIIADVPDVGDYVFIDMIYVGVEYEFTEHFTKYMAREFKGKHCIDVLESVCKLEGAEWYEDYINYKICLVKQADFEDSGIDLTQDNYTHDWEYEDQCNQVKYIYVWGKTSYNKDTKITVNIFAKAINESVEGDRSKQIIDDSILTLPDAQEIADTQLALLENKRPSIRIPLIGTNPYLQVGKTVDITMSRPTVAKTAFPIRMINRSKFGKDEISTIIHAGLGETEWDEKLFKAVKKLQSESHRISSERLISTPWETGVGGIIWENIIGRVAGVETVITTEVGAGESIDNAIDALILTHKNLATAHQDAPALILAHKGDVSAHHVKYTNAEVDARIVVQNTHPAGTIDIAIDALILTHKNIAAAHHTKTVDASELSAGVLANARVQQSNITQHQAAIDHDALTNFVSAEHVNHDTKIIEKSDTFPANPTEGQLHYDVGVGCDDSLYRYSSDAGAWIEIGASGIGIGIINTSFYGENLTERNTDVVDVYTKVKEFSANCDLNTLNITWEMKLLAVGGSGFAKVYVNGVAVGVEKSIASTTYTKKTDTIYDVHTDDLIQIYAKLNQANTVYVKNMYCYFGVTPNDDY